MLSNPILDLKASSSYSLPMISVSDPVLSRCSGRHAAAYSPKTQEAEVVV